MKFDFSYLDIAFKNGSVITVNETDEIAEAVGVKGNKIVFVGSNADIDKLIDEKTKVVDLKGRTLMPGLNDTHYHPILNGMIDQDLDSGIVSTGLEMCKTIPELLDLIRRIAAGKKPGKAWAVIMVGRCDDYLRDVAADMQAKFDDMNRIVAEVAAKVR